MAPRGQWALCTQGHKALISSPDSGACVPAVCQGRPVSSGRHVPHLQPGDHHHAASGVRLQKRSRWERHWVNCSMVLTLLRVFLSFQAQLHTLHTGLTLQPRPGPPFFWNSSQSLPSILGNALSRSLVLALVSLIFRNN